jgi:hypothetical protein
MFRNRRQMVAARYDKADPSCEATIYLAASTTALK